MTVVGPVLVSTEPSRTAPLQHRLGRGRDALRLLGVGDRVALALFALVVAAATIGPMVVGTDPMARAGDAFLGPGSPGHLLGTDDGGRDNLVRLLVGLRVSLWSSLAVVAIAVTIGAAVGLLAGATGGAVDWLLMRVTDVFLALPGTLMAVAAAAALGAGLRTTLLAVAAVWWPWYARIVRNEVWALSSRPHVDAARMAGASGWRRARRHLLPGVWPPLLVTAALDVGAVVLVLAGLSFFGLGAPAPQPELGAMTARGTGYLLEYPWVPIVPAVGLAVLAFTSNLAGESVRALLERR